MTQPSSPEAGRKPFQIPSLDGLRAVSFLLVFLGHAATKVFPGYFGLAVFFFLSGYLITTLLRMEFDQTGGINFRDFYLRRVLRIFPPFYLVLGAAYLLSATGALDNPHWTGAIPFQVFHLTNYYIVAHGWWTGTAPGTWILWSLAVEEHFYLVFPLVYLLMRRRGLTARGQAGVLLGLCAAVLAWRCLLVFGLDAPKDRVYVATDTRVDSILFGCLLAVWGNPALDAARAWEGRLKTVWLPLAALVILVSFVLSRWWPAFDQTFRYTVQGLALIPVFLAAVRFPAWGIFRWLNARPAQFVGLLSYSLYLLHTTVLYGVERWTHWPKALVGLASLALCLALSTLILYGVEKPAARLRKRLSHTRRPPTLPAPDGPAPESSQAGPPLSRSRLVARNVLATLASQLLSWSMSFGLTVYLTRYLGAGGLGALTLAGSIAGVFSIAMALGTSTVLTRDIARDTGRTAELTLAALAMRLPLGLLAVGAGWLVAGALGYSPSLRLLVTVAVAAMLAGMLNEALGSALRGLQEIPRQNAAALADKAVMCALVFFLISRHAPLWAVGGAGGVSALVALLINASAFGSYWRGAVWPSWGTIRALARQGMPFLTTAVFVAVYGNCDAVLMSKLSSLDAIGWYGLAKRLGGTTLFIPVALTGAMLPALSRVFQEDRPAFEGAVRRMFNFVLICAVPFAAVLVMAPGQIIALVTNNAPGFAPAAPVLMILGATIILWFLSQAIGTALIACDRQAALSRITAVSALICVPVTGTLIFVTHHALHNGAIGAVLGDALIEAYMVTAYVRALPPGFFDWKSLATLGRAAAAALPLVGLFYFVHDRNGLLFLVPGLLLYVPLCLLLRCLHPQDTQMVRRMWKGRTGT
jgi:peptidoglycan/LPS O-acetylase OafA/YrhL/O-antigen/teichoic acid export membrane protein